MGNPARPFRHSTFSVGHGSALPIGAVLGGCTSLGDGQECPSYFGSSASPAVLPTKPYKNAMMIAVTINPNP